jgi:hypothetical protein
MSKIVKVFILLHHPKILVPMIVSINNRPIKKSVKLVWIMKRFYKRWKMIWRIRGKRIYVTLKSLMLRLINKNNCREPMGKLLLNSKRRWIRRQKLIKSCIIINKGRKKIKLLTNYLKNFKRLKNLFCKLWIHFKHKRRSIRNWWQIYR